MSIRDYIEGFELSSEELAPFANEARSLVVLGKGLDYLSTQVHHAEERIRTKLDPAIQYFIAGNAPLFSDLPKELLLCTFHWYAVTVWNYLLLVGWLRRQLNDEAPTPNKYAAGVAPEIQPFRNKVAAHFARAYELDNQAERQASTIQSLAFRDGVLVTPPFSLTIKRGHSSSNSAQIQPWSVTLVHRRLARRFTGRDSEQSLDNGAEGTNPNVHSESDSATRNRRL